MKIAFIKLSGVIRVETWSKLERWLRLLNKESLLKIIP